MRDEIQSEVREEAETANPYGDVALGVECAWPETLRGGAGLAVVEALSDASISIRFQL